MNILVCIKQVPDTTMIKIDPVTNTLIRDGVPSIVNPFDGYALEVAVRLKEAVGGKVTVATMGPPQAIGALRECLAVGADEACLISDRAFGGFDTLATSFVLATSIRAMEKKAGEKFDIIFCGKQAIDGDTGQVGPSMAEHLQYPQITYASDVTAEGNQILVKRECDKGYDYCVSLMEPTGSMHASNRAQRGTWRVVIGGDAHEGSHDGPAPEVLQRTGVPGGQKTDQGG